MPTPDESDIRAFLAAVQRQLTALEIAEQQEIIDELSTHVQDAVAMRVGEGLTRPDAEQQAVNAMGDPEAVGRRIRGEHLVRRLSLRDTLFAVLPLIAIVLAFSQTWILQMVRNAGSGPNNGVGDVVGTLLPLIAIAVFGLWRTRQAWPATLLGSAGVFSLLVFSRKIGVTSHSTMDLIWFMLAGLAVVAVAIVFVLRWGSLRSTLAILSGVAGYGYFAWLGGGLFGPSLLLVVVPIVGVCAVCLIPRRWHIPTAWVALSASWVIITLYPLYYFTNVGDPQGTTSMDYYPMSSIGLTHSISLAVLTGSGLLLLAVQAVSRLQARGRLERFTRLVK